MPQFKFGYVPPNELEVRRILKEGEGFFHVKSIKHKLDKNCNDMLILTMKVRDSAGTVSIVDDYLTGSFPARIHEFALAVGLPGLYNASGAFDSDKLIGLQGGCVIKTDSYTGNDGTERKSSKIAMYLVNEKAVKVEDPLDQEIPF
jgi:hypothetical protein